MQFKPLMSSMLIGLLTVSLITPNVSADTEGSPEVPEAPEETTSNATVTFTPGDGTPPVLDPTAPDPENPYVPGPGDPMDEAVGESGPLTLDFVSSLTFGEHKIEADTQEIKSTTLRPFVQVTDRRGSGEGWKLTAQMSSFIVDEETTLPGAALTLNNGSAISNSDESVGKPVPNIPVELVAGGEAAPVVTAAKEAGLGSWITRWFPSEGEELNDNVKLEIPAGTATAGDHSATIVWELSATP